MMKTIVHSMELQLQPPRRTLMMETSPYSYCIVMVEVNLFQERGVSAGSVANTCPADEIRGVLFRR